MPQRVRHPPSDESDKERKAYQSMLSEMKVHREIIKSIRNDLRSINLSKITDVEVRRYQKQINMIVEYIADSTIKDSKGVFMINRFVKAKAVFERVGNLIVRKFNLALSRWQECRNPRKSAKQRNDAEEVYQEVLNDCRTELGHLLDAFRDF
jgi:hypothetical protein